METDVFYSSFNLEATKRMKEINPEAGVNDIMHFRRPGNVTPLQLAEKNVSENIELGMNIQSKAETMTPELVSYANHRGVPLIFGGINTKWDIQGEMRKGATTILNDHPSWMEEWPLYINSASASHQTGLGETVTSDTFDANLDFRTKDSESISEEIRVAGSNDGVVEVKNNGEIKALRPGEVTLQIYHDFNPFNVSDDEDPSILDDTWRMYSTPITLTVEGDENAKEIKETVEYLSEEGAFEDEQVTHDLKLHLKSVHHFEKKEEADKVIKHMKGFKKLLDNMEEEGKISDDKDLNILRDDTDALIQKWKQK